MRLYISIIIYGTKTLEKRALNLANFMPTDGTH